MFIFTNSKEVNYWKLLSVGVLEWNWIFLISNLFDILCFIYLFVYFWVEHAIEYIKTFDFSNFQDFHGKKWTILTLWFVIHFPWVKPTNSSDLRCDVCRFSTFDLQTVKVITGQTKVTTVSTKLCGIQYLIKEEKRNGASVNIKLFFAITSNWPRLKLFDEQLSGTYMANGDFSLMADWACQQSRSNLQFDMLQAELFDSHDSNCHPQS